MLLFGLCFVLYFFKLPGTNGFLKLLLLLAYGCILHSVFTHDILQYSTEKIN